MTKTNKHKNLKTLVCTSILITTITSVGMATSDISIKDMEKRDIPMEESSLTYENLMKESYKSKDTDEKIKNTLNVIPRNYKGTKIKRGEKIMDTYNEKFKMTEKDKNKMENEGYIFNPTGTITKNGYTFGTNTSYEDKMDEQEITASRDRYKRQQVIGIWDINEDIANITENDFDELVERSNTIINSIHDEEIVEEITSYMNIQIDVLQNKMKLKYNYMEMMNNSKDGVIGRIGENNSRNNSNKSSRTSDSEKIPNRENKNISNNIMTTPININTLILIFTSIVSSITLATVIKNDKDTK